MKVNQVMNSNPVTCGPETTLRDVAGIIKKYHIGGIPVVEKGHVLGIITESDILRLLETGRISEDLWLPSPLEIIEVPIREFINWEKTRDALTDFGGKPVREVMHSPVITIGPDDSIEDAAALILKKKISRLPVISDGQLVGIVTRRDIVEGVAAKSGELRESGP